MDGWHLTQPQLGETSGDPSQKARVHLSTRLRGKEFLTLVTWSSEPFAWNWHFYNARVDRKFQLTERDDRARLLSRLLGQVEGPAALDHFRRILRKTARPDPVEETPVQEELPVEDQPAEKKSRKKRLAGSEETPAPVAEAAEPVTHNLIADFEELNAKYFNGELSVPVVWTRQNARESRRGITFGLYDLKKNEIRMNSRLNQDWVPDVFVKSVLFHEMLHVVVKPIEADGKVFFHHKEFRRREREFEGFREAKLWQKANWRQLMKPVRRPVSD